VECQQRGILLSFTRPILIWKENAVPGQRNTGSKTNIHRHFLARFSGKIYYNLHEKCKFAFHVRHEG
jgi:hypothetical protein